MDHTTACAILNDINKSENYEFLYCVLAKQIYATDYIEEIDDIIENNHFIESDGELDKNDFVIKYDLNNKQKYMRLAAEIQIKKYNSVNDITRNIKKQ